MQIHGIMSRFNFILLFYFQLFFFSFAFFIFTLFEEVTTTKSYYALSNSKTSKIIFTKNRKLKLYFTDFSLGNKDMMSLIYYWADQNLKKGVLIDSFNHRWQTSETKNAVITETMVIKLTSFIWKPQIFPFILPFR